MKYLFTFLFILMINMGQAQNHQDNQLIVQTNAEQDVVTLLQELKEIYATSFSSETLCADLNIFSIQFADNQYFEAIEKTLSRSILVRNFQRNHAMVAATERCLTRPNDSLYFKQWNLRLLKMEDAWCKTKGGLTATKDSIVIGVMEYGGYDFRHQDLLPNIWRNYADIPNNNKDDDNNGYVDDYFGLNAQTNRDDHPISAHGTAVIGVMGATMGNTTGITGINKDIKMMLVSNTQYADEWVKGLAYFLNMRKRYNEGKGGTFVAVVNTSASFDRQKARDFPILCQMYDELGKVGILNVAATLNNELDVDVIGDIPADCSSEYLIISNHSTPKDTKYVDAAYGKKNVDLFAPGEDILTTTLNNKYSNGFTGSSMAAPHVAGAIALLYSMPATGWMEDVKAHPSESALKMKDFILKGVKKSDAFAKYVATGGRLDINQSMKLMEEAYSSIQGIELHKVYPNPTALALTLQFDTNRHTAHRLQIFNAVGQFIEQKEVIPDGLTNNKYTFNVDNYPQGVYIARFISSEDNKNVFRFVVIR